MHAICKVNMTNYDNKLHIPTCVVSILYTHFKIYTRTGQITHKMILHFINNVLKQYLVSNEMPIKLLFFCFLSLYIISYFLLPSKYTRWKMSEIIFLCLCSFKGKLHAYLFNLCTENSAIAYDKYNILISRTKVMEFPHNSILNVFQTNRIRICHLLHSL